MIRPFTENECANVALYRRCKALKRALMQTGVMYSNAIAYCGYNGNYARSLSRLYDARKTAFYAAANQYIREFGANAYVF